MTYPPPAQLLRTLLSSLGKGFLLGRLSSHSRPLKSSTFATDLLRATILGLAALLFIGVSSAFAEGPFYIKNGDTIVFYGDSITEQRFYTTFTETYILTRFPGLKVNFIHSGWGGDRVTGGGGGPIDQRLARDVFAYHPTVVTIMLGMNDGSYRAFDQTITDTYEQGYRHIVDVLQKKLPGVRLTLIQPSPFDDVTRPPVFPGGYNSVLLTFSQFVKDLAEKNKQTTADFNTPVVALLLAAKQADPDLSTKILPDRVHPSPGGHLIMAEALLKAWNAPSLVTDVEIDAAAQKVVQADHAKIDNLKADGTVSWTETDAALPMPTQPADPNAADVVALALKSSDFTDALNREPLRVTGLTAPYYELDIDNGAIGVFSQEDLAKGVNLATQSTPMMDQAVAVQLLTVQHNDLHYARWRNIQVPLLSKNNTAIATALPPILRALDAEEKGVVAQQRAKAQPVAHTFKLIPQQAPPEIAVMPPADPVLPPNLGPNLALHKTYVSSNPNPNGWDTGLTDGSWVGGAGTTYATDDNPMFPKTVTIDLEKPESVAYVLIGVPPFGSTKTVNVSLSADNKTFTPIGGYTFPQNAAIKHLFTCTPTNARYVRLTYLNRYPTMVVFPVDYVFTTEVEIYSPVGN
jgi:lysophospholipase L1-like esterase